MDLKNLFFVGWKKKHNKKVRTGFERMTKREKKQLLSNDFIDRMIRVEQRVSTSFGEYVPYKKTRYYLSLAEHEKKNFDKYQKNKKSLWKVAVVIAFVAIAGIAILGTSFTGNVINETMGTGTSSLMSNLMVIAMLVGFAILGAVYLLKKKKERKFHKKFHVIDKIVSLRRFRKK